MTKHELLTLAGELGAVRFATFLDLYESLEESQLEVDSAQEDDQGEQVTELQNQVGEASAVMEKDVVILSRREVCELLGYASSMANKVLMKKSDDLAELGITPVPNSIEDYGGYQYYFDKSVLTLEERIAYNLGESPFARYPEILKLVNQSRAASGKQSYRSGSLRNRLDKLSPEERSEIGIIQPGGQRGSVIFRKRAFMQTSAML